VTISPEWGALTNGTQRAILGTRRHTIRKSEAWIAGEAGSMDMRWPSAVVADQAG